MYRTRLAALGLGLALTLLVTIPAYADPKPNGNNCKGSVDSDVANALVDVDPERISAAIEILSDLDERMRGDQGGDKTRPKGKTRTCWPSAEGTRP